MAMIYTILTIFLVISIIFNILLWMARTEPKEYIEGRTIIELIILAREYLIDSDKLSLSAEELDIIDFDKIEQWMKDAYHEKVIRKLYGKKTVDKILKIIKESKVCLN